MTQQPKEAGTISSVPAWILHLARTVVSEETGCHGCPLSDDGRFPGLQRVTATDLDKGQPGDLAPVCAKSSLGPVERWQGHRGLNYPNHLNPLRLFKCRQWFWIVVPGLRDDAPTVLQRQEETLWSTSIE